MEKKIVVEKPDDRRQANVSLAPLDIKNALSALLAIANPEATRPKPKREKIPPKPDKA